ncbi:MAG: hypothetical protein HYU36_21160 [Planctomycetes bacterium]|nr:hypothetical protein [Planctomycetota bacterium]
MKTHLEPCLVATPGRFAFPIWAAWPIDRGPFGHRSLILRTDHRADAFSEYLLVDLETMEHRGVVFENLPEVYWGCLHRRPDTSEYYALTSADVYRIDWERGQAAPLDTGGFSGKVLRTADWQGPDTLWVLAQSPEVELFRLSLAATPPRVELIASLRPPVRKVGLDYVPQQLRVTPGGKVWASLSPGLVVSFFDPARPPARFLCNLGNDELEAEGGGRPTPVRFLGDRVRIGMEDYDLETGDGLGRAEDAEAEPDAPAWLGLVPRPDGCLYFPGKSGQAGQLWGQRPPDFLQPHPEGDHRWQRSIGWHAVHGEYAFGTSSHLEPRIGLLTWHGPTARMEFRAIPWKPSRPQQFYSMHVGPDGAIYGSNYSMALWRIDPETWECRTLGWAIPPRAGGEIWAFTNYEGRMFFAGYTHSWLGVYDPSRPWQAGTGPGDNPRSLFRLFDHAPDQHRPRALAAGSDGRIYMASCADYGKTSEGALAAYHPRTDQLDLVRCPLIPGHQLSSLAAPPGRPEIYAGSYQGGLHGRSTGGAMAVWDIDAGRLKAVLPVSRMVSFLAATDDRVAGVVFGEWKVFFYDPATGAFTPPSLLGGRKCFYLGLRPSRGTFLLQQEGQAFELDPKSLELRRLSPEGVFLDGSNFLEGTDERIYYRHTQGFDIWSFRPVDVT